MAHTSKENLKDLKEELDIVRSLEGLQEKGHGIFYKKSQAFLHFHDKDGRRWAHVKTAKGWLEVPIEFNASLSARNKLINEIKKAYSK